MQVVVGNDEKELSLRKHGGDGGKCRAFQIADDDYIVNIQYTYQANQNIVHADQIIFETKNGLIRVIGDSIYSKVVNYEFSIFQPFLGFYT